MKQFNDPQKLSRELLVEGLANKMLCVYILAFITQLYLASGKTHEPHHCTAHINYITPRIQVYAKIKNTGIGVNCYGKLNLVGRPPVDPSKVGYIGIEMAEPFRLGIIQEEQKKSIMINIIRAVAKLHDVGIFHGDIKSSNVCLKKGRAYLIDYEFATFGTLSSTGRGTKLYRRKDYPPLVISYTPTPRQRDFFALGVLLLELHSGRNIQQLVSDHREKRVFRTLFEHLLLSLRNASIALGVFIRKLIGLNATFRRTNDMLRFFESHVIN